MQPDPAITMHHVTDDQPDVMRQFQQLMSQFLQTQALVMTTYLQGAPASIPSIPAMAMTPPSGRPRASAPTPVAGNGADEVAAAVVLGGHGNGGGRMPAAAPAPVAPAAIAAAPAAERHDRPASTAPGTSAADVLVQLLQIVGERTGYPEEMLNADSSIEADLGIDSIKRMEILAAFQQMHAGANRGVFQGAMEKLSALKTLRETAAALTGVLDGQTEAVA